MRLGPQGMFGVHDRAAVVIMAMILAFLGVFFVYPIAWILREGVFPNGRFSLVFFVNALSNPVTRQAIWNSFAMACCTTVLTCMLALPMAFVTVRYRFPLKKLICGLLLLPMIMPPFLGAIGMLRVLARFGSLNLALMDLGLVSVPIDWLGGCRFWGVVLMQVLHLYPIMWLNIAAALGNVDPAVEDAAVNMGSGPWNVFRRVTLPLAVPGIFAGATIIFIWSFTDLGTPLVFEYRRVIPVRIFDRVNDLSNNPEGYALVILVVALTATAFILARRFLSGSGYDYTGKGGGRFTEKKMGPAGSFLAPVLLFAVIGLACLPHAAVVLISVADKWFMSILPESYTLAHYGEALEHNLAIPSIRNSVLLSVASTVVSVCVGVSAAYIMARKRIPGRGFLDTLVMMPLAVPGLVVAFGYIACFSGTALDPRNNPVPLLVVAYSIRRLPFMVRSAYAGLQQISPHMEEAAINLGASNMKALVTVTVPLIAANLAGGAVLVFSFAMLEVSDSLILAIREQFFPITKAIYVLLGRLENGNAIAGALGVWAMAFLGVSLLTAGSFMGKRMGRAFRI